MQNATTSNPCAVAAMGFLRQPRLILVGSVKLPRQNRARPSQVSCSMGFGFVGFFFHSTDPCSDEYQHITLFCPMCIVYSSSNRVNVPEYCLDWEGYQML